MTRTLALTAIDDEHHAVAAIDQRLLSTFRDTDVVGPDDKNIGAVIESCPTRAREQRRSP